VEAGSPETCLLERKADRRWTIRIIAINFVSDLDDLLGLLAPFSEENYGVSLFQSLRHGDTF
jgi:hypothetical protein